MKKIYCLFSIENQYDQPDNSLVAWFSEKPGFERLAKAIGVSFTEKTEDTLAIVGIWRGNCSYRINNKDYRLEEVEEFEA